MLSLSSSAHSAINVAVSATKPARTCQEETGEMLANSPINFSPWAPQRDSEHVKAKRRIRGSSERACMSMPRLIAFSCTSSVIRSPRFKRQVVKVDLPSGMFDSIQVGIWAINEVAI